MKECIYCGEELILEISKITGICAACRQKDIDYDIKVAEYAIRFVSLDGKHYNRGLK